ncbi:heme-binding protein [Microbacterium panaciterrae]|uniref:Heme-binding protein n=1 Tax=Microbacterium panaciterrae TaxID=985759 RepID=A0ABP8P4X8_9MICO
MPTHRQTVAITYETAARAVALAMEIGRQHGVIAVVAVADPSMTLIAYGMADGATPHSAETSRRKAATAASTRRRTAQIPEALAAALPLGTGGILTTIDGGVPIFFGELLVGGLGVAGGSPAQDAEIALETLKRLGARTEGMQL